MKIGKKFGGMSIQKKLLAGTILCAILLIAVGQICVFVMGGSESQGTIGNDLDVFGASVLTPQSDVSISISAPGSIKMQRQTQIKAFVTKSGAATKQNVVANIGFYVNNVKVSQKSVTVGKNQLMGNCVFNWTPTPTPPSYSNRYNLKVKIESVNVVNANKANDISTKTVLADWY